MNGLLSPDDMMMAGAQGVPSVDENALMQSLYGMGDYSEPHFLLPIANVGGEIVPSFPGFVQPIARTVARSQGAMPLDTNPNTGLPTEDVLMDAFDLASAVTGAGLLMERPAGSIGMGGRVKASPSSRLYDDLFENMGDEGAGLEFPDVGEAVNKYIYDMDFNALQSALKSDDYSGYSKNLRTNLDSLFPNDKISVSRVENYSDPYAGIEGRRSKSFFDVDKDDVLFVGSDAERELIVRGASGSPMSVRIEETPRSSGLLGKKEDVSDTLLMQQPKKRPKIRQMPQAEQDLYEAAAAFQLPREVGEGLLLPRRAYEFGARTADVGSQGLLVDPGFQNLSRDMPDLSGTVVRDLGTLARSPDLDIQSLIGRTAKLMPGDMTMAGKEITHVQGIKLKNPVRMTGGKDFSSEKLSRELGIVWASDPAVISGYAKQAREIPGLLGIYTSMGGRGGDFSHHVADVLVDMTKQAKKWIPEEKIADFDEQVRNLKVTREDPDTGEKTTVTPFTDFPGITSRNIEKYLYSPGKGAARKAVADTMEKSTFRDSGFPDVTAVRMVVSDPQMSSRANDPSAMLAPTGGRIVEFDADPMLPMSGEGNMPEFHKTYRQAISGTDLGGLSTPVPRILLAPDFFAARRAAGKAPSSDRRSAEISNVLQEITQPVADDVSVFQDYFNRGLLGKGM